MGDGNYNDLHRAERALADGKRQLQQAQRTGQATEQLEANVIRLQDRLDTYKNRS